MTTAWKGGLAGQDRRLTVGSGRERMTGHKLLRRTLGNEWDMCSGGGWPRWLLTGNWCAVKVTTWVAMLTVAHHDPDYQGEEALCFQGLFLLS